MREPYIPVDVVLPICGEVVVDDEGNLLDIDAPGEQVGGDEETRRARPELPHDNVTLLLIHVAMLKISCMRTDRTADTKKYEFSLQLPYFPSHRSARF